MLRHVIQFTGPADYLSMNDRRHWRRQADLARAWSTAAYFGAAAWRTGPSQRRLDNYCTVRCVFPVVGTRRRDPHNWYPTVKACIDGLVHANVWPDDSSDYIGTSEPLLVPGVPGRDLVLIIIDEYTTGGTP